jgi:hypothetical protein
VQSARFDTARHASVGLQHLPVARPLKSNIVRTVGLTLDTHRHIARRASGARVVIHVNCFLSQSLEKIHAKTGDTAIAEKILLASPDAGQAEQRRLFREAGGVNLSRLSRQRRRMGRAGEGRAKTGDTALAKEILLASPDAGQAEQRRLCREAGWWGELFAALSAVSDDDDDVIIIIIRRLSANGSCGRGGGRRWSEGEDRQETQSVRGS